MTTLIEDIDRLNTIQGELLTQKKRLQINLKKSSHKTHKYKRKNRKHGYKKHKTSTNHLFTRIDKIKKEMIENDKKIRLLESKLREKHIA